MTDPSLAIRPRLGRRARHRFARALPAALGLDPGDALFWLEHPELPGPTGAPGPEARLAAARRDLYRRAPAAEARAAVEHLEARLREERAAALRAFDVARPRAGGRTWSRTALVVAFAVVSVVVVAVVVSTVPAPLEGDHRSPRPTTPSEPAATARTLRVTGAERARILALFAADTAADDRAMRERIQSAIDQTADGPYPADGSRVASTPGIVGGRAVGRRLVRLGTVAGGAVTVAVVLDRAADWDVRLVTAGRNGSAVRGSPEGGPLQYALLLPSTSARSQALLLDVPDGTPYAWQVLRRG